MKQFRMIDILIPRWKPIVLSVVISIVSVVLQLLSPLIMKTLIDYGIPKKDLQIISLLVLGLVLVPIFSTVLMSIARTIHIRVGGEITDALRMQLFEKILSFSPGTINRMKTGDLVGRFMRVTAEVGDYYVRQQLLPSLPSILMFVGVLSIMVSLNFVLTIISLIMIPVVYVSIRLLGKRSEKHMEDLSKVLEDGESYFTEMFQGVKTVQLFGRQNTERKRTQQWLRKAREIRNRAAVIETIWMQELISQFQLSLTIGILFAFGVYQIIEGKFSVGSLVAFIVYVPMLYESVRKIQTLYLGSRNVNPSLRRLEELYNKEEKIADPADPIVLPQINGDIEFRNVSFEYEKDRGQVYGCQEEKGSGWLLHKYFFISQTFFCWMNPHLRSMPRRKHIFNGNWRTCIAGRP